MNLANQIYDEVCFDYPEMGCQVGVSDIKKIMKENKKQEVIENGILGKLVRGYN